MQAPPASACRQKRLQRRSSRIQTPTTNATSIGSGVFYWKTNRAMPSLFSDRSMSCLGVFLNPSMHYCLVTGHDFSHAEKCSKKKRALAPAGTRHALKIGRTILNQLPRRIDVRPAGLSTRQQESLDGEWRSLFQFESFRMATVILRVTIPERGISETSCNRFRECSRVAGGDRIGIRSIRSLPSQPASLPAQPSTSQKGPRFATCRESGQSGTILP
jgi:hypothetical protein